MFVLKPASDAVRTANTVASIKAHIQPFIQYRNINRDIQRRSRERSSKPRIYVLSNKSDYAWKISATVQLFGVSAIAQNSAFH